MKGTWTIIGLSFFLHEIIELVSANNGMVREILINREPDEDILRTIPKTVRIVGIDKFVPETDFYVFGFTSPEKRELVNQLASFSLNFANLIHPNSTIPGSVQFGQGNVILPGVVIGTRTKIGDFNFINRSASIGHDVLVGGFNHFAPGVTVCGKVQIGDQNFIGAGGTIIDRIRIGDGVVIGAGGVATEDISESGKYVGVPARRLK